MIEKGTARLKSGNIITKYYFKAGVLKLEDHTLLCLYVGFL